MDIILRLIFSVALCDYDALFYVCVNAHNSHMQELHA